MAHGFPPISRLARLLLLAACAWSGAAVAADPAPAINVSEICTTCNDVIRCERDAQPPVPGDFPVVVYYLHPHTTWEQVATIWEYLIRFGRPKQEDTRELTVFEFSAADGPPARVRAQQSAGLSAVSMTIDLPGARIDRRSGDWLVGEAAGAAPLERAGSCKLLPPADGFAFLRANAPGS